MSRELTDYLSSAGFRKEYESKKEEKWRYGSFQVVYDKSSREIVLLKDKGSIISTTSLKTFYNKMLSVPIIGGRMRVLTRRLIRFTKT